jgi:NADH-quinone oxidoreductase subunit C
MIDAVAKLAVEYAEDAARVDVQNWALAGKAALDSGFGYFCFLSAIDWLPNPGLDGEKYFAGDKPEKEKAKAKSLEPPEVVTDEAIRICGGTTQFQVIARVQNLATHEALMLFADVDEASAVPSWASIYSGSDWHERETWEMFGIRFDGHPGLRHIYLPEEFEGNPLRKDFPLAARLVRPWPGLVDMEEMPAQGEEPEQDFA